MSVASAPPSPPWEPAPCSSRDAADSGQLYAVFTSGTLNRYRLAANGTIAGANQIVKGPGWGFVSSLGWMVGGTYNGVPVDGLLALSSGGSVIEYLIRLDSPRFAASATVKTGWTAYSHVTSGDCGTASGAPFYGVTKSANGYLWYDSNIDNLSGTDMWPVGQKGTGLTGLVVD